MSIPILNFWQYKVKEKLLATVQIKATLAKVTLHPTKPTNVLYLLPL